MKHILVVIPFIEIYPPMNGGKQRALNLLHQLSEKFDVTAIIHQDGGKFAQSVREYPALRNCTVFSTKNVEKTFDLFSLLPGRIRDAFRYRYWNRSLKGPAESNLLLIYPILKKLLKTTQFDYAILEDMGTLNIARLIHRCQPDTKVIYDAHNVNSKLAKTAMNNGQMGKSEYEGMLQMESNLSDWVDGVFACSEIDLSQLVKMNKGKIGGAVIPNGVNLDLSYRENGGEQFDRTNNILFCGSLDYFPNQEGLTWFCKEIFPLILQQAPDVRLLVVGKGAPGDELLTLLKHDSITYYGMVDNVSDYYRRASVAVVPLLSGSGTRLKLLEAMGNSVAVVSTAVGAEGIDYTNNLNILIADENASFADAVVKLVNDGKAAGEMANQAFLFVKQEYDWRVIGEKMSRFFNEYKSVK
jgi:polysaccharide biosynthesis protein PslH